MHGTGIKVMKLFVTQCDGEYPGRYLTTFIEGTCYLYLEGESVLCYIL